MRRSPFFFRGIALGAMAALAAVAVALAGPAPATAADKTTLVLGVDISDTRTFDPARQFEYSPPITVRAAYETLITLAPERSVSASRELRKLAPIRSCPDRSHPDKSLLSSRMRRRSCCAKLRVA